MICESQSAITVATLNVRGLCTRKKQYQIQRLLLKEQPDFLALQETKLAEAEQVEEAVRPFMSSYEICVTHAVGHSAGCFLLLKKSVPLSQLCVTTDTEGRFIMCDFVLTSNQFRLICIYAPNVTTDRVLFFGGLRRYLDCDRALVLVGDFNCVVRRLDRSPIRRNADKSELLLGEMLEDFDLVDVGTVKNAKKEMRFTHFQASSSARLDRVYVSAPPAEHLGKYRVTPVFFSDHSLVIATIGDGAPEKKKFNWNLWKLNINLLKDNVFLKNAEQFLKDAFKEPGGDIFEKWELAKQGVRNAV